MTTKYRTVHSSGGSALEALDDLAEYVNKALDTGWQLAGGVSLAFQPFEGLGSDVGVWVAAQSMFTRVSDVDRVDQR